MSKPLSSNFATNSWDNQNIHHTNTTNHSMVSKCNSLLPDSERKIVQQIIGTFLFYARAVDSTMLTALSALSSDQANATEHTGRAIIKFLNYCATHPDAQLPFYGSDMLLKIHSDASYLSVKTARSRAGGHFYLGNAPNKPEVENGAVLSIAAIIKMVMSSACEAEIASIFTNAKEGFILRTILIEMGHPQNATPILTDNSTASGIANENIKQQRSRAIDMRFYWVRDQIKQGQFIIYWGPGSINKADYHTKHHAPSHHQEVRPQYVLNYAHLLPSSSSYIAEHTQHDLRGCIDPNPEGCHPSVD